MVQGIDKAALLLLGRLLQKVFSELIATGVVLQKECSGKLYILRMVARKVACCDHVC